MDTKTTPALSHVAHVAHVFVADKLPTEREVHCLLTHHTNKQMIETKIVRNGRVVHLICPAEAFEPRTITLESNRFVFKRTEAAPVYEANAGDIATVSVRLCYTYKKKSARDASGQWLEREKTETVVDLFGQLKPHLRLPFMRYLERETGLGGLVEGAADVAILPEPTTSPEERENHHVWFIGAMQLNIRARVRDAAAFNRLAHAAIGNRRSYGFGGVSCDLLEPAGDETELQSLQTAEAA